MPQSPHPVESAPESPALNHLPYQSLPVPLGNFGVDLSKKVDLLPPGALSICSNAIPIPGFGWRTRPGLIRMATDASTPTAGVAVHSILRVNDPYTNTFTRFWGMSTTWRRGIGANLDTSDPLPLAITPPTTLESGFSGDPLALVPWTDEFGHTPVVYVGDRTKMRKATLSGASLPIGLPAPVEPVVSVNAPLKTTIAHFAVSDSTAYFIGKPITEGAGFPVPSLIPGPSGVGGILFVTDPGTAPGAYDSALYLDYSVATGGAVTTLNLAQLPLPAGAGFRVSTDDDLIHLWMKFNVPAKVEEIKLYFQCSPFTDPVVGGLATVPGTQPDRNFSAYMRAFRPSDYTKFISLEESATEAATTIRANDFLRGYTNPTATTADAPSASPTPPGTEWVEYGIIGRPLRKADFLKIGSAGSVGTDWSTITAIWVVISATEKIAVDVALDDLFLTGGYDPDTAEPDAQAFDYRVVHYDTASGARSNPSPVSTTTHEAARQLVTITPAAAYGLASVRQEAYRRGGANGSDWFFVSANSVDGGPILDTASDTLAAASSPLEIDHDQPVTTVAADGTAIYAQPVRTLFGPIEGYLFACGDPNRPGTLYWCTRNEPDHWPAANHWEVCPPTEELQNGAAYGAQGFVFSRERMYSIQVNLLGGEVTTLPTDCDEGLVSPWALAIGLGGIFGVSRTRVFVTTGGQAKSLSDDIQRLFDGEGKGPYSPIDFRVPTAIRLALNGSDLWFGFQDTAGHRVWWVYSLLYTSWRFVEFAAATATLYAEPTRKDGAYGSGSDRILLVGGTNGIAYVEGGTTDDGTVIPVVCRTGALSFGQPREEKLFGDVAVRARMASSDLTITARLNADMLANVPITISGGALVPAAPDDSARYILDLFGTTPQHGDSLSLEFAWSTRADAVDFPTVMGLAVDTAIQPAITMNRATTWHPLNETGEAYLMGCSIDCDTGGTDRTILVEGLLNGAAVAIATLTVNSNHGRRRWFSWPAVHVDMVRLRPTGECEPWMLFGQGWITDAEPPRVSKWDSNFENRWDTYCTGLDLEVDTLGQDKTIEVYIDSVLVKTQTINTTSRLVRHITIPWTRGHVYRFRATDNNLGLLYAHRWHLEEEPSEQTNWNQNYTIAGTHADKWLKGVLLECDTFGEDKQVTIEVNETVIHTEIVNTTNRTVVHIAFPQVLGRVFRVYPTDDHPGRLYSMAWLFDEEPLCLTRYETQEQPDGIRDFHLPVDGQIAIKSVADVTLTITSYGQSGVALGARGYTLPATVGAKSMLSAHTFLLPQKGLLFKFVFTSASGFWLYSEESWLTMQPLQGGAPQRVAVFGNDDLDPSREMRNAALTAARRGGDAAGSS